MITQLNNKHRAQTFDITLNNERWVNYISNELSDELVIEVLYRSWFEKKYEFDTQIVTNYLRFDFINKRVFSNISVD